MQALVLAGGEGTRLRPLTLTLAKPVMPLAGRPFLTFMLDWLRRHGVDDVLLSCGYRSEDVERVLGSEYSGMRLRYVLESEPLGTAGPLRLAADEGVLADRVVVLNGDCLTDIDLTAEIAQHEATDAVATLALIAVEDTSSYGVVPTNEDREVEAFLEKQPGPAPTNRINAGVYVLEREVVERVPAGRAVSIEREVFPELVGKGLYGFESDDYWIDIGTPERYLEATYDLLAGRVENDLPRRDETASLIYDGCITSGARIGPLSVLGRHCSVGDYSTVERAVLHDNVRVGHHCEVVESVLAEGVRVADDARIGPDAIVGAGATVAARAFVGPGSRDPARRACRVSALDDILAMPHQIGDALWRIESAGIPRRDLPGGVAVCGPSGGAGALAAAALGERATAPVRDGLDADVGEDTFVLCASYSGDDEDALACFVEAGRRGAPRAVVCTAGALAARAREEGVPVIGVPAGIGDPTVYFTLAALECAALTGTAPSLRAEAEAAVPGLTEIAETPADEVRAWDPAKLDELAAGETPTEETLRRMVVQALVAAVR